MKRLLFLILFVVLGNVFALADSVAPPRSYQRVSSDKKYVFVMISPKSFHDYGDSLKITEKYKVSGLYLNDGSTNPLWTVDWYAHTVYISSDGVHLVRSGPWPGIYKYKTLAVAFYANGKELKSYSVNDLVDLPSLLPTSVSHYMWSDGEVFNDNNKTFSVGTLHMDRYVFDVVTGKMISSFRISRFIFVFFTAVIILIVWRRWRKASLIKGSSIGKMTVLFQLYGLLVMVTAAFSLEIVFLSFLFALRNDGFIFFLPMLLVGFIVFGLAWNLFRLGELFKDGLGYSFGKIFKALILAIFSVIIIGSFISSMLFFIMNLAIVVVSIVCMGGLFIKKRHIKSS